MDTLFGFGWLPKIIFGISSVFWKKNMFCFLSMFLNNVEKNGKNIYSYIYIYILKKIVFKVNIHNLPQFFNHTVALVQNKNERISLE